MRLYSYLYQNRFGIYYLRIQKNGVDRRVSLRTRDPDLARLYSYQFGASISPMKNNNRLFNWGLKLSGDSIEITDIKTADEAEHAKALAGEYFAHQKALARLKSTVSETVDQSIAYEKLVNVMDNYILDQKLASSNDPKKYKSKTIHMDTKVLRELEGRVGDIYVHQLTDALVREKWREPRLREVKDTTVKKELSSIKKFVKWCRTDGRTYIPNPLTLTVEIKASTVVHYDYFDKEEMSLIVESLPTLKKAWHFWLILLGMYTGARIGELGELRIKDFNVINGVNTVHILGPKTEASPRTIPIHPKLIELGLLDYVELRKKYEAEMLFPITYSEKNGWGAAPSKWFGRHKRTLGINGELKVFHSFRETLVDLMKQADVAYEKRCQYVGHETDNSVHSKVYARGKFSHIKMKNGVVDLIDWCLYYDNFNIDFEVLKVTAQSLLSNVRKYSQ